MKIKKINKKKKSVLKNRVIGFWKDKSFLRHKFFYLTLAAVIFFIAILARTYHITTLPPGIYPDEAVNGTDAIAANETGNYRLFYPNNYGREGLFMNLIALGFKIFGVSVITLKMWSVFFGVFTVAGIMLLARELFGTYRAGIVAGFLYATSFWAINFNRISFRANMLPFVLVFTFYFLFKGLREKKYHDYILAGVFFGLGMHGYIAFRIAPLILVALFFAFLISKKNFLREYWKPILSFFLSALVVALPILLDFYFHPEYFETRSESVSVLSPKVNQGHLGKALGTSIALSLGMFNFHGDQNWRHNLPQYPALEFFAGIFFLVGFGWVLIRFFRQLWLRIRKKKRSDEFIVDTLLLSWFFAMLLPGILTYEGLPHSLRVIGTLPAVFLLVTFAIEKTFELASHARPAILRNSSHLVLVGVIIWSGYISVKRYFIDWAGAPQIHPAFSQNFKNMALYLNNLPKNVNKYVMANAGGQIMDDGLPVSAEVVKLLTYERTPGIIYYRPGFDPKKIQSPAKVVLMYYDGEAIAKIKSVFPGATVQKIDPQPGNGTDYFVINVH
ncbi:MAG: hypothetical protein A3J76_03665 [Candidatus Moranbacteria bacterium RBG_13_45_13]|nr:MAG: hypothetical protein A3J76_03665 [Candidatus Moranbacteria bacterium RBG_13_45_13]